MGSRVDLLLWAWIVLDSGVCSVVLPEITDGKFIDECVREHNRARSSVNPPASDMLYMTWDEALAITARAWAKHCVFDHNPRLKDVSSVHPTFSSVGENIWTGYPPSSFDATKAIKKWVDEKADYNYERNTCSKVCGHYTQVVWGSSYKVGCAAELCPNGVKYFNNREGVVFVCNYATAGNTNRRRPYETKGAACSGCEGTCSDSLCRDQKRDSQQRYSWTPYWDPTPDRDPSLDATHTGSSYVTILVVRPVGLIFTFITAYAVHHYYPDVFCYE
ncbi:glioma pathogenesis-related protein 1 [Seriola lalandi dorsalis]|uniref:GLI pathosis related 1 n=1 Tax=Seriola lalandi dorsalis TaxID=1841481 RepID=A0A3B4X737_SERLL|nr:glioma pathogenesis-related protein 1 [Seriola lalandi dorsalis]